MVPVGFLSAQPSRSVVTAAGAMMWSAGVAEIVVGAPEVTASTAPASKVGTWAPLAPKGGVLHI